MLLVMNFHHLPLLSIARWQHLFIQLLTRNIYFCLVYPNPEPKFCYCRLTVVTQNWWPVDENKQFITGRRLNVELSTNLICITDNKFMNLRTSAYWYPTNHILFMYVYVFIYGVFNYIKSCVGQILYKKKIVQILVYFVK